MTIDGQALVLNEQKKIQTKCDCLRLTLNRERERENTEYKTENVTDRSEWSAIGTNHQMEPTTKTCLTSEASLVNAKCN